MKITREITEIEQSILDGFYRIILQDLRNSWQAVSNGIHIRRMKLNPLTADSRAKRSGGRGQHGSSRGDNSGMMNIGIPSIMVKMCGISSISNGRSAGRSPRKRNKARILRLIKPGGIHLDGRLNGPSLSVEDLLNLAEGDVLTSIIRSDGRWIWWSTAN